MNVRKDLIYDIIFLNDIDYLMSLGFILVHEETATQARVLIKIVMMLMSVCMITLNVKITLIV